MQEDFPSNDGQHKGAQTPKPWIKKHPNVGAQSAVLVQSMPASRRSSADSMQLPPRSSKTQESPSVHPDISVEGSQSALVQAGDRASGPSVAESASDAPPEPGSIDASSTIAPASMVRSLEAESESLLAFPAHETMTTEGKRRRVKTRI
ncbi:MAG: hypothetical protein AAF550_14635 [Myxococcota bacterium]